MPSPCCAASHPPYVRPYDYMMLRLPPRHQVLALRCLSSEVHFNPSFSLQDIMDRNLEKNKQPSDGSTPVLTTKREALALYRDVWRYSRLFVWTDELGRQWKDVIRESARQEFEASRHQKDPQAIARLLVVGRDSLQQSIDKYMKKRNSIIERDGVQAP